MDMEVMKAAGICRKYGKQDVLTGLDLALAPGSFEALMGPSGCGKSTFLHLAAGLLKADAGTIEIGGADVTAMGDAEVTRFRRRHVGVVFQAFNLLNEKTVGENIWMPLILDRGKRVRRDGAAQARFADLVGKLGLSALLGKKPEELSGGEQQRVAIARALLPEPEVILADEPTGNLDAKSAKGICEILKDLNATEKSAILVVTHDPVVAACAKKVHFLKDGKISSSFDTHGDAHLISSRYLEVLGA